MKYYCVNSNCVGCGACVRDCPLGVLELREGRPCARAAKAALCIDCRHCVAVCPTGAFSVNGVTAAELPRATIDGLLETLKHVPMGCNERHAVFHVVSSRARMDELRRKMEALLVEREKTLPPFIRGVVIAILRKPGIDPFFRGAPHLLIVDALPEVGALFGLQPGAPFFAMLFGVPAVKYLRTVPRPDGARVNYL